MRRWCMRGIGLVGLLLGPPVWADGLRATDSYTPILKTSTVTTTQSATVLWTPPTGQRIVLQWCSFSSTLPVSFLVQSSGVDVIPLTFLSSYGSMLVGGNLAPIWTGAKDATLTYTTSKNGLAANYGQTTILCVGYEENR